MKPMKYGGYSARIEYSDQDGCFVGHIAGIKDIVGFHGESVAELRHAFEEAVEDYLDTCAKIGKSPQKTYSGKLMLRVPPETHAAVAATAEANGKSINQLVREILDQTMRSHT